VDNKPNGQANQNSHQGKQNQHFKTNPNALWTIEWKEKVPSLAENIHKTDTEWNYLLY
jgi:hypothetical protein